MQTGPEHTRLLRAHAPRELQVTRAYHARPRDREAPAALTTALPPRRRATVRGPAGTPGTEGISRASLVSLCCVRPWPLNRSRRPRVRQTRGAPSEPQVWAIFRVDAHVLGLMRGWLSAPVVARPRGRAALLRPPSAGQERVRPSRVRVLSLAQAQAAGPPSRRPHSVPAPALHGCSRSRVHVNDSPASAISLKTSCDGLIVAHLTV